MHREEDSFAFITRVLVLLLYSHVTFFLDAFTIVASFVLVITFGLDLNSEEYRFVLSVS